jgi:hypothetical protein
LAAEKESQASELRIHFDNKLTDEVKRFEVDHHLQLQGMRKSLDEL